jgi:outer membrane lipopolysaccharide assembly protein LptE/RlpB
MIRAVGDRNTRSTRGTRFLAGLVLLLFLPIFSGCGYRLANKNFNAGQGQTIAVPTFINKSTTFRIEQRLSAAVRQELIRRTRYTVTAQETGDVVLSGEVLSYVAVPVIFDQQGRGSAYSILVDMKIIVTDKKSGKELFRNDRFTYRDVFELAQNSADFVPEDTPAQERLATRFASSLVSTLMHAKISP